MHSIFSAPHGQPHSGSGQGGGGQTGGGAEEEHFGSTGIGRSFAGQKETIITPISHATIPATRVIPAIRSLNKRFIKAINSVKAIKYNKLLDFLLLPI